jgi:hypothetical protein
MSMSDAIFDARSRIEEAARWYDRESRDRDHIGGIDRNAIEAVKYVLERLALPPDTPPQQKVAYRKRREAVRVLVSAIDSARREVARLDREIGDTCEFCERTDNLDRVVQCKRHQQFWSRCPNHADTRVTAVPASSNSNMPMLAPPGMREPT